MSVTAIDRERLEAFAAGFAGTLLEPGTEAYEDARRVHNGLIDRRPSLIARCLGTADVVAAVALARELGLEVSVRGGAHNVGGRAVTDGGLMIDLSAMRAIHVDPAARTLRAQGGALWRDLNREAHLHGLATTGGAISTTGVGGFTLGGGLGWLMGKHGLAVDNLLSVELVTASGDVVRAAENENPDLFWAVRGGGGNFGVATWFEFRMHELPMVYGGLIAHPLEAAPDLLRVYREVTAGAPDELTVFGVLGHAPDGSGNQISAVGICYAGDPESGERAVRPLLEFGSPLIAQVGPMPYPAINMMMDEGYPKGALNYWKSTFLEELSDATIDAIAEAFATCPSPASAILLEHFHGAVSRVPGDATPVSFRGPGYNCLIPGEWFDPADTDVNVAWVRSTFEALQPFRAKARWLNYLGAEDEADALSDAYGANFERLREAKRRWDPDNVFHLNQNIDPR